MPEASRTPLAFRPATDSDADLSALVGLYDAAARWMAERGIDQWKPGQKDAAHFRTRLKEGEVWLAVRGEVLVGAWELWWEDVEAWGVRAPDAGYVHRLMTARDAPPGTGRALLAEAERRIAARGRPLARLDCVTSNPRLRTYYEAAGYEVAGALPGKVAADGSTYGVTLLQKRLGASRKSP
ncbi:GNAT family N-acetyltransferase [Streptomyces cavernicola]|uniref:GNAT family N-acetyltransferase n=1 Tax=Streptomyces cavernicola TaxID=3043613 RepID=A0ABT6S4Y5_9ACTN|nr:GNAT family N-acetyltransferase [Streptomyces sp. B-S-A6]MDI3403157.1 GNAT family N-acetyltransferase [Streptomyces sp. B-S-A6]